MQVFLESRVGGGDAAGFVDRRFALGKKAEDGAGHGDAVIAEAADLRAGEFVAPPPWMVMPSSCSVTLTPKARRLVAMAAMRSVSFTRNSLASRISVSPSAMAPTTAMMGSSSMTLAISAPRDFCAAQLAAVDAHGAERLAGGIGDAFADVRAHAQQHAEQAGARAVEAEVGDGEIRAGHGGGGGDPESGGGEIARHVEVARVQSRAAAHADGLALAVGLRSMTGGAWKWASRRSVWSRDGVFSVMLVVPVAKRPASSRHDFNCALATGSVYSMPVSGAALDLQRRGVLLALALEFSRPSGAADRRCVSSAGWRARRRR